MTRLLTYLVAISFSLPVMASTSIVNAEELTFDVEEVRTPAPAVMQLKKAKLSIMNLNPRLDVEDSDDLDTGDTGGLGDLLEGIDLSTVINYGVKVWEVVKANEPVVTQSHMYANALPQGLKSAYELEGASPYQYRSFRISAKNYLGFTVYDVVLTLAHQYGASYEGKGAYITSAAIIPSDVNVLWGYTVDLNVKEISTANVGSKTSPIASLGLELNFHVSTVLKKTTFRRLVEFLGNEPKARMIR